MQVSQTDLVPTLSLLMGLPIPFSNLGMVVKELFQWDTGDGNVESSSLTKALRVNAHQISAYLKEYSKISEDFPIATMRQLMDLFDSAERDFEELKKNDGANRNISDVENLHAKYRSFLVGVRKVCQDIWARFDVYSMICGICLTISALVLGCYWFVSDMETGFVRYKALFLGVLLSLLVIVGMVTLSVRQPMLNDVLISGLPALAIIIVLGSLVIAFMRYSLLGHFAAFCSKGPLFCTILLLAGYFLSLFSNSFVVHEDKVTAFLFQTLVWIQVYSIVTNLPSTASPPAASSIPQGAISKKSAKASRVAFDIGRILTSPVSLTVCIALVLCLCIRASAIFRACREEQWPCEESRFLTPLSAEKQEDMGYKNFRYFFSVFCILSLPLGWRLWLRRMGNLNGYSPGVMCICYVFPVACVAILLYWALQSLPHKLFDQLPVWQVVAFPRIAYVCAGITVICLVVRPLCLFVVKQAGRGSHPKPILSSETADPVARVFNHLKQSWEEKLATRNDEHSAPLVYGLATVYSSSVLVALSALLTVLMLLLGDGMVASVLLQVVCGFLLLELTAVKQRLLHGNSGKLYVHVNHS